MVVVCVWGNPGSSLRKGFWGCPWVCTPGFVSCRNQGLCVDFRGALAVGKPELLRGKKPQLSVRSLSPWPEALSA